MGSHDLSLADPVVDAFWRERILCTVTLIRPDGRPHVTPMGVALGAEPHLAWAITNRSSYKARLLATPGVIAACMVDRGRWSTLYGTASVRTDPAEVEAAVAAYAARYRQPSVNPDRVAIRIDVERVIGRA